MQKQISSLLAGVLVTGAFVTGLAVDSIGSFYTANILSSRSQIESKDIGEKTVKKTGDKKEKGVKKDKKGAKNFEKKEKDSKSKGDKKMKGKEATERTNNTRGGEASTVTTPSPEATTLEPASRSVSY